MGDIDNSIKLGLKSLLETKSYEKITVSDLCEKAHISRRTFYKYYPNIESIVVSQIRDDFILPVHETRRLLPVDEIKSSTALMIEATCNTVYENRECYRKLLHYKGNNTLIETIVQEVYLLNTELYEERLESSEERAFVSYLFSWMSPILLLWWIDMKSEADPKTMAKLINRWAFSHWRELEKYKFTQDSPK